MTFKHTQYRGLVELRGNIEADWYFKEQRPRGSTQRHRRLTHYRANERRLDGDFRKYERALADIVDEFRRNLVEIYEIPQQERYVLSV
jgi:hypothetical protein